MTTTIWTESAVSRWDFYQNKRKNAKQNPWCFLCVHMEIVALYSIHCCWCQVGEFWRKFITIIIIISCSACKRKTSSEYETRINYIDLFLFAFSCCTIMCAAIFVSLKTKKRCCCHCCRCYCFFSLPSILFCCSFHHPKTTTCLTSLSLSLDLSSSSCWTLHKIPSLLLSLSLLASDERELFNREKFGHQQKHNSSQRWISW